MRSILVPLLLAFVLAAPGCAKTPPTLTPVGAAAFHKTETIKDLNLFRDVAIAANAQTPPFLDTASTRKIVTFHKSALLIMDKAGSGWQAAVQTALNELLKDLPADAAMKLAPYVTLLNTILAEVA
jgi:hypothetical protein